MEIVAGGAITDDFIPDPESDPIPEWDSSASDPRPNFGSDDDVKTCAVVGCENETALTPKGRKGKYCSEHNTAAKRGGSATSSATRQTRSKWGKAPEVERALNQFTNFLAIGVAALGTTSSNEALVLDAQVISEGMPNVNHELVELAKNDPTFRKYLEWLSAPGKYGALVSASLAVVLPIMVNHNMFGNVLSLVGAGTTTRQKG